MKVRVPSVLGYIYEYACQGHWKWSLDAWVGVSSLPVLPSAGWFTFHHHHGDSCAQVLESRSAWRPNFGSLKYGVWNNTWKNWGKIAVVFLIFYGIEAGYFAGLLYSSQYIRQQTYRALPTQYFGEFIRTANVYTVRCFYST